MVMLQVSTRSLSLTSKLKLPMIKFRYGSKGSQSSASTPPPAASTSQKHAKPGEAIYDFQLPARYRRVPLSAEEINYINSGGPA